MGSIKSILFVCTGNSCRSVMAEGLMKKYLKEMNKNHIEVFSAGTSAADGFSPTEETIKVMKEKASSDVSGFISKKITEGLIKRADLILAMETKHKDYVVSLVPEARSKTYLLKEFGAGGVTNYPENPNIPDPIGRPMDYYRLSFEIISEEIKRIAGLL
jgi:protein-tyrosine-phosphatase